MRLYLRCPKVGLEKTFAVEAAGKQRQGDNAKILSPLLPDTDGPDQRIGEDLGDLSVPRLKETGPEASARVLA